MDAKTVKKRQINDKKQSLRYEILYESNKRFVTKRF